MHSTDRTVSLPTLLSAHGRRALADAHAHGWTLCSYASPVDDARDGLTVEQAAGIAAEDAGLIYVRAPGWLTEGARVVAGRGPDREHGRIASIDWATATAVVVWYQGITTSASVLDLEADSDQPAATTTYSLTYRAGLPSDLPGEGTLAEACELAAAYDTKIELSDAAGFVCGWVYPDGNYRLT